MKSKYLDELADTAAGYSRYFSDEFHDGKIKAFLGEAAHALDSANVWVDRGFVKNARGAKRKMTLRERLAFSLFGSTPRRAT